MNDANNEKPLNGKQLADALNRSRWFVTALKRAGGYRFRFGTQTTLNDVLQWLEKNPQFRSQEYKQMLSILRRNRGKEGNSRRDQN